LPYIEDIHAIVLDELQNSMPKLHRSEATSASGEAADDRLLPLCIRRPLWCAGALVAYSQCTSVALLPFYRHIDSYADGNYFKENGYLSDIFLVLWLASSRGSVGLIGGQYPWFAAVIAILIAGVGSTGLLAAARARRTARFSRTRVLAGCAVGIFAAAVTQVLQIVAGPNLSFRAFSSFERGEEAYPMHGVLEYVAGVWLPVILYALLVAWLVGQFAWGVVGCISRGR
jgi:hypothetical protein